MQVTHTTVDKFSVIEQTSETRVVVTDPAPLTAVDVYSILSRFGVARLDGGQCVCELFDGVSPESVVRALEDATVPPSCSMPDNTTIVTTSTTTITWQV